MDLVRDFLSTLDSKHTRRAYETDLAEFFGEHKVIEQETAEEVGTEDIQGFLRSMRRQEYSTATQRRRLTSLRRFFDWLVREGRLDHNPARSASLTIADDSKTTSPDTLTKEQLESLIRTAGQSDQTGARDRALLLTIVYGALRRREVASLDTTDLRPLGRHWVIDLPRLGTTQGGYVKIPDHVVQAIESAVDLYDEKEGPLWRSFSNRNRGERMSPDAIYKIVRRVSEEAGLGSCDIQTLRRTGLKLASKAGANLNEIQSHARLKDSSSATVYVESTGEAEHLRTSIANYLGLNIEDGNAD